MKTPASLLLFFLLWFSSSITYSQIQDSLTYEQQDKLIEKASKEGKKSKSLDPLLELEKSGKITNPYNAVNLTYKKAILLYEISPEGPLDSTTKKEILRLYQQTIDSCKRCDISSKKNRYEFLKEAGEEPELRKKDLEEIKKAGYKEERDGLGLGLVYNIGKEQWLGAKISLYSIYSPPYRLRKYTEEAGNTEVITKDLKGFSMDFFTLNYAHSLSSASDEFYVDLMRINNPISISISQIGFQRIDGVKGLNWFYRPEIGFGFLNFSVAYSYNLLFASDFREKAETHLFTVRMNIVAKRLKLF